MNEICKRKSVMVIQGDVLEEHFELIGIAPEVVKTVCFRSEGAKLLCECPYSNLFGAYCLRLPSTVTEELAPVICSYDLTVEFADGNVMTLLHECPFAVLKKRNYIEGERDGDKE